MEKLDESAIRPPQESFLPETRQKGEEYPSPRSGNAGEKGGAMTGSPPLKAHRKCKTEAKKGGTSREKNRIFR